MPRKLSNMSFPASLVPLRLSKWSFPASLAPPCQRDVLGSRPWRPPQDLPRTGPFAIEVVLKVRQNPAPFQNRDSIGNPALQVSLVPPSLSKWRFPASLVPPWCLAGCPIDPFLPPCKARGVNPRPRGRPKLMTSVICQGETRGVNPK